MSSGAGERVAEAIRDVATVLRALDDRWRLSRLPESLPLTALMPSLDRRVRIVQRRSAGALWPGLRVAEALVRRLPGAPDTCLHRSLARYAALRRAGVVPIFVLGVRTDRGDVEGHAWIEVDGEPWHDANAGSYTVTFRHADLS